MGKKVRPLILHEVAAGKHRIVVVSLDQTVTGAWAELHELAELNGMKANSGANSRLPKGIFRVVTIDQQVLV